MHPIASNCLLNQAKMLNQKYLNILVIILISTDLTVLGDINLYSCYQYFLLKI